MGKILTMLPDTRTTSFEKRRLAVQLGHSRAALGVGRSAIAQHNIKRSLEYSFITPYEAAPGLQARGLA